jgi:hypothetical protein
MSSLIVLIEAMLASAPWIWTIERLSMFLAMPLSSDRVRVRSTVIVFAGSGELPIAVSLPSGVADFEDVCVRSSAGSWLYQSRIARTIFIGPAAASFAR